MGFSQKIRKHFQYLRLVKKFVPKTGFSLILGPIMLQQNNGHVERESSLKYKFEIRDFKL